MRISSLTPPRILACITACITACLVILLTGCSLVPTALPPATAGSTLRGNIHGGQQPIVGARIYLLAAGTTGYGSASTSLLTSGTAGSDSIGGYVLSDSNGSFSFAPGSYACTSNNQVYLYALGGDPGAGVNSAAGLLAALGNCPNTGNFAATVPFIWINEVSTVAAAYAFSAFATDATHVGSSGTSLAQTGIANAFANTTNLADISTGVALATTPSGNGTVPQAEINTLANILAACVNSTGPASSPCSTLFDNARSGGSTGTSASDTASAAINIAHNPGSNTAALYTIPTPIAAFAPALSTQPNDFTVALQFTGGGLDQGNSLAIDGEGNIWATNSASVAKFNSLGAVLSPPTGYPTTAATPSNPIGIALDPAGAPWIPTGNSSESRLLKLTTTGTIAVNVDSGVAGPVIALDPLGNVWLPLYAVHKFAPNGAEFPVHGKSYSTSAMAIDHLGNVWLTGDSPTTIVGYDSSFSPLPVLSGGGINNPVALAFDSSNNLWVANSDSSISALDPSGTPLAGSPYNTGDTNYISSFALDGDSNPWSLQTSFSFEDGDFNISSTLFPFAHDGTPRSTSGYPVIGGAGSLAIDGSGNIWLDNTTSLTELIGISAPVVTPLSSAVANNTLATRP